MGDRLRGTVAAAAVHLFTASGIVCALFAMLAVLGQAWETLFLWLGLALVIDGVDGFLARAADVETRLPRFSGERLDQVIDYITYVFIPALALLQAGYLGGAGGIVLVCVILLSSLFHFSDMDNKSADHCFVGFPAIWNIVAFYVFAFSASPALTAIVILICAGLTFVPMRWVHPIRVEPLRLTTVGLTAAWIITAACIVWQGFPAHPAAQAILAGVGLYAVGLSLAWPWIERRAD